MVTASMGTPSSDKKSKKRKRVQDEDENESFSEDHVKKSAKKKKIQSEGGALQEKHDGSENGPIPEERTPNSAKPSKKRKRSQGEEQILQDESGSVKKSKKKNKKENHKTQKESQDQDSEQKAENDRLSSSDDLEHIGNNNKVKKSSSNEEENISLSEQSESKKVKKKSKKEASSFGVVDTKLLKDHGGEDVEVKKKKKKKPTQVSRALEYLHLWKYNFRNWKFSTLYQSRLMKILYDSSQVSDEDFEICLEYFEKCQGKAREKLKSDAFDFIKEGEDEDESADVEKEKRARQVLQMLG